MIARLGVVERGGMELADRQAAVAAPEVAFDRLVTARLDAAYRLAAFILAGDRAEAEDAVHDAALRAWQHFGGLRDPDRFDAWFTRIVVNVCRDRLARRRVRLVAVDAYGQSSPDHADRVATSDALEEAMRTLTPEHRIVVALRYLDDCSIEEIAARTGERRGTVKSRLHYALRALRAALVAGERDGAR